jgi:hypothetical protein
MQKVDVENFARPDFVQFHVLAAACTMQRCKK